MPDLVWLSYPLDMGDPRPPAIPAPTLTPLYTVEKDGANVQILRVANHTGTHVDAPRHVIEDGLCLTDFAPEEFLFWRPCVIDLPLPDATIVQPEHLTPFAKALEDVDLALFRFGYGAVRRAEPERYSARCPGFGVASGRWLRDNAPGLRAIGMDVPSVACIAFLEETMTCHNELLSGAGRRFLIIEDMNLEQDLTGLREVRLNPWLVNGMDSGPCSVAGVL
jgi:kynurenine formamidase